MKNLFILSLLVILSSCEFATLKYGYYWNPLKLMEITNSAIDSKDVFSFSDILEGKIMCIYGTAEGLEALGKTKEKLKSTSLSMPALVSSKTYDNPVSNGIINVSKKEIFKAVANFGTKKIEITMNCYHGKGLTSSASSSYCNIIDIKDEITPIEVKYYCK